MSSARIYETAAGSLVSCEQREILDLPQSLTVTFPIA